MTVENLEIKVKATGVTPAAKKLTTLADAMDRVEKSAGTVGGSAGTNAAKGVEKVGKAAAKANKPLGNLLSSLKRIAFYRIIRGIIKSITQAFSEGLEKAYLFSEGISEVGGHRFAAAMDRMKSSANAMKGQLGSAFISLLTAIMPLIIQLIQLITKAADVIAQFFAAFTGTNYLKAIEAPAKWADNAGGAAKAAKEWKNQLLGFDEINRLNEPSNRGGSGTNPLDGFDFEATPINEKILRFVEKLKGIIAEIKEHADLIRKIVIAIGIGLAAWKIGSLVAGVLGLGSAFAPVIAAVGLLAAGIYLVTDALIEWINTGKLSSEAAKELGLGIVAIGAAISILTGSWIPALIAGVVALVLNWDSLKKEIEEWRNTLKSATTDGKIDWRDFAYAIVVAIDDIMTAIDWVVGKLITLCEWINNALQGFNLLGAWSGNSVRDAVGKYLEQNPNGAGAKVGNGFPGLASGGFPTEGQLFIANEAGPELVGSIGGRTAVANNGQIVEGIRQGVYDAVVAANANGNSDVSVRVYLDSREIKAGQNRLNRAWGV